LKVVCALILSETLALYKSFTYLLTYFLGNASQSYRVSPAISNHNCHPTQVNTPSSPP